MLGRDAEINWTELTQDQYFRKNTVYWQTDCSCLCWQIIHDELGDEFGAQLADEPFFVDFLRDAPELTGEKPVALFAIVQNVRRESYCFIVLLQTKTLWMLDCQRTSCKIHDEAAYMATEGYAAEFHKFTFFTANVGLTYRLLCARKLWYVHCRLCYCYLFNDFRAREYSDIKCVICYVHCWYITYRKFSGYSDELVVTDLLVSTVYTVYCCSTSIDRYGKCVCQRSASNSVTLQRLLQPLAVSVFD